MCSCLPMFLLVLTNVIFFLVGALLLIVGILMKVDYESLLGKLGAIPTVQSVIDILNAVTDYADDYSSDLTDMLGNLAWILIGFGAFLFIIGFLGAFGACKKNVCILYVYAAVVIVILLGEIGVVIFVAININSIEEDIAKVLDKSLDGYQTITYDTTNNTIDADTNAASVAWDSIQVSLKCCGVYNYTSFEEHTYWNKDLPGVKYPMTCCKDVTLSYFPKNMNDLNFPVIAQCMSGNDTTLLHSEGCYSKVLDAVDAYLYIIIGVFAGVVLFEILCIISACYLARKAKDK